MGNFQDCVFHRFHRSRKLKQNTCQQILSKFDVLNSNDKSCSPSCHVYFKVFREPVKKSVEFSTLFGWVPSDNIIKSDIVCSSIEDNYLPI